LRSVQNAFVESFIGRLQDGTAQRKPIAFAFAYPRRGSKPGEQNAAVRRSAALGSAHGFGSRTAAITAQDITKPEILS